MNDTVKKSTDKILQVERTDDEFKELVYTYVKQISKKYKIFPKNIYYRIMKSKWGSCSSKKNLTINTLLKLLPEDIIRYVILHEMVHIIERKHSKRFWEIITHNFPDYESREQDLFVYWFLIQSYKQSINKRKPLFDNCEGVIKNNDCNIK
jgi:hypothetical protein